MLEAADVGCDNLQAHLKCLRRLTGTAPLTLLLLLLIQLYPYHLAGYAARVMRITPFKYYCDVLFMMLKDEKSYDRIPNFTVRRILQHTSALRLLATKPHLFILQHPLHTYDLRSHLNCSAGSSLSMCSFRRLLHSGCQSLLHADTRY